MSLRAVRIVTRSMMILWVMLFGLYVAEEMGYLPDTSEDLDTAFTQTLTMPADQVVYTSDVSAATAHLTGIGATLRDDSIVAPPSEGGLLPAPLQPLPRSKLFQLYSVYRI